MRMGRACYFSRLCGCCSRWALPGDPAPTCGRRSGTDFDAAMPSSAELPANAARLPLWLAVPGRGTMGRSAGLSTECHYREDRLLSISESSPLVHGWGQVRVLVRRLTWDLGPI